jgi:hypothetical protein
LLFDIRFHFSGLWSSSSSSDEKKHFFTFCVSVSHWS